MEVRPFNMLDNDSQSPLYKQLKDNLFKGIKSGAYPADSRIPSEPALCERYGVSRVTVRRALKELTDEGLLVRRQGKGTFVAAAKLKVNLKDVTGFSEACRAMGKKPSSLVIGCEWTHLSSKDAAALNLNEGDMAIELNRLRLADDMPVMLEKNVFSKEFAFLFEADLTQSLYDCLAIHGFYPQRATHDISLCHASLTQARYLQVDFGEALLHLYEVIFDSKGEPLHTSLQTIRGDRFTFRI